MLETEDEKLDIIFHLLALIQKNPQESSMVLNRAFWS